MRAWYIHLTVNVICLPLASVIIKRAWVCACTSEARADCSARKKSMIFKVRKHQKRTLYASKEYMLAMRAWQNIYGVGRKTAGVNPRPTFWNIGRAQILRFARGWHRRFFPRSHSEHISFTIGWTYHACQRQAYHVSEGDISLFARAKNFGVGRRDERCVL